MAVRSDTVQIVVDIEAQQGVRAFQKLTDQSKQLSNEMRKLKRAGKENSDEFRGLEKRAAEVNAELAKLGGAGATLGQLRSRAKQLSREIYSLAPGTKRFTDASKELADVRDRMKEIRDASKSTGQNLGEMQAKTISVGGAFRAFIALEVVQYLVQLFQILNETTKEFIALRRTVSQFTGAVGDELDDFSTRVDALAKTYGKDAEEILLATNSLTKQLTGDFSESLDLVEAGFLAGADANGEYLDSLREYPAFFREAGLSGEQFIGVITQSVREGVFSDKGVDLIKEFVVRVREMPKATAEALEVIGTDSEKIGKIIEEEGLGAAFQEVQRLIGNIEEDAPAAGQALADIFGGPGEDAGIQFVKNLQLTDEALGGLISKGDEFTQQLREQYVANLDLSEAQNQVSKQFGETSNSLQIYTTRVKAFLFNVANEVLVFFDQLPSTARGIQAAFSQVFTNIGAFFQGLKIDAQIALKELAQLNPFNSNDSEIQLEIDRLERQKQQIREGVSGVMDAYKDAYLSAQEDAQLRKAAAQALTPPPDPAQIQRNAVGTVRSYAKAVDDELAKIKAERANKPGAVDLLSSNAPGPVASDGSSDGNQANTDNLQERLRNRFLRALITEQEYEDQRFQLQQEAYDRRLAFLAEKYGEESQQFIALENQKLEAQRTYEQQRAESTKRTEEFRLELLSQGTDALGGLIDTTISMLKSEEGERKKNSLALKAFSIGKVLIDTQEAIMAIIKTAQANPANILFPGAGNLIAGIKIAAVGARSALAIQKIRGQKFYEGGPTGNRAIYHDEHGPVVGAVHANEWVAPQWQVDHPQYGPIIGWLESMRQRGFKEGGFTTVDTTPVATDVPSSFGGPANQQFELFREAIRELQDGQREMTMAVKRKQFSVPVAQVRDALEEDYRLDEKARF